MSEQNTQSSSPESSGPESIGGGWLGTFLYEGRLHRKPPVRFEATLGLPDGDGKFVGTILDDEDGGDGEADVSGGQSGLGVRFSKVYRAGHQTPVFYEGTLAEGGRTMTGTWRIADRAHGVWDARRVWSESTGADAEEDEQFAEYALPALPREVVRLGR